MFLLAQLDLHRKQLLKQPEILQSESVDSKDFQTLLNKLIANLFSQEFKISLKAWQFHFHFTPVDFHLEKAFGMVSSQGWLNRFLGS